MQLEPNLKCVVVWFYSVDSEVNIEKLASNVLYVIHECMS